VTAPSTVRPFCSTPAAIAAFERWRSRLELAGVILAEPDLYVLGLASRAETRLEELGAELAQCKDAGQRLRLLEAERKAAIDVARSLDHLERVFGAAAVQEKARPVRAQATGTEGARVIAFQRQRGLSMTAQRIVAVARKAGVALTRTQLRQRTVGSEPDFLAGLRQALDSGALRREGSGTRGKPYMYRTEE